MLDVDIIAFVNQLVRVQIVLYVEIIDVEESAGGEGRRRLVLPKSHYSCSVCVKYLCSTYIVFW